MQFFIFSLIAAVSLSNARSINISGKIFSAENGAALPGVNIYIENSSIGTTSDESGFYQIKSVPDSKFTLIFSYVGFAEKRTPVFSTTDTTINVKLSQTILDGPIVTAFATQAKSDQSSITYSNLDKKDLIRRYNTQDIPELLSELPSTTFYSENGNGIGYNYLSIRGFDQRRISVLINGIPQNDPEDHNIYWLDFPDLVENIQTIQVQRGAGNAFYGPAAIGGSINIKTDHFSPDQKIKTSFGAGSFNTRKFSASYNSGLLAGSYIFNTRISNIKSDGYRDRAWVNFWSYFFGLARYTDNNNLRIHFYGGPIEDGLAYGGSYDNYSGFGGIPKFLNSNDDLRRKNWGYFEIDSQTNSISAIERRDDEIENFNQPHLEILHEWQIDKEIIFKNNFFYTKGYGFFDYDGSWIGLDSNWEFNEDLFKEYTRLKPEYGYTENINIKGDHNALIRAYVDNDQFGWLPQVHLSTSNGDMVLGAELRRHRSLHWGRLQKANNLPQEIAGKNARHYYEYKGGKDIASMYFHNNYEWYSNIILQTDMQFVYKKYLLFDEKYLNHDFTIPYTFFNPRIGILFNISTEGRTYFNLYSTTREPRLNNLYNAGEASDGKVPQFEIKPDGNSYDYTKPLVKPETLTGMELGYSHQSANLTAGINFFYMSFLDEIVASGGVDRFGQPITGNAEKTLHYGLELHSKIKLMPALFLSGNFTFSKNRFKSYRYFDTEAFFRDNNLDYNQIISNTDTSYYSNLKDNPLAGFPEIIANIRLTYAWNDLYLSLAGRFNGESYTDNFKNKKNKLDSYSVFNLTANYNLIRFGLPMITIQGSVNNLLNKKYLSYGEGIAFFPAAIRNFFFTLKMDL